MNKIWNDLLAVCGICRRLVLSLLVILLIVDLVFGLSFQRRLIYATLALVLLLYLDLGLS